MCALADLQTRQALEMPLNGFRCLLLLAELLLGRLLSSAFTCACNPSNSINFIPPLTHTHTHISHKLSARSAEPATRPAGSKS